jgi:hypothetical protein
MKPSFTLRMGLGPRAVVVVVGAVFAVVVDALVVVALVGLVVVGVGFPVVVAAAAVVAVVLAMVEVDAAVVVASAAGVVVDTEVVVAASVAVVSVVALSPPHAVAMAVTAGTAAALPNQVRKRLRSIFATTDGSIDDCSASGWLMTATVGRCCVGRVSNLRTRHHIGLTQRDDACEVSVRLTSAGLSTAETCSTGGSGPVVVLFRRDECVVQARRMASMVSAQMAGSCAYGA